MNNSEKEPKAILEENRKHIERLDKMVLNMYSVANIRYWYWCLSNFKVSPNIHEDIMKMDALTTSIVISYGRLFGQGTGTTVLNKAILPVELTPIHDAIIDLRNGRYAHHGDHETINTQINIEFNGSSFVITPSMQFVFCLGAPKEWKPLFEWLDAHMHETIHKQLDFLTRTTGIQWEFPDGPAP